MKVLNIWGGPGTGKSTTAAGVFYHMKSLDIKCELIQEYAKDMVWEQRHNILEDQIYIFAKQQRRISRLRNHGLDWVITDSPIPLGLCYTKPEHLSDAFVQLVMQVYNSFDNYNFYLTRNVQYDPVGRNQKTEGEAVIMDDKIKHLLTTQNICHTQVVGGASAIADILASVHNML